MLLRQVTSRIGGVIGGGCSSTASAAASRFIQPLCSGSGSASCGLVRLQEGASSSGRSNVAAQPAWACMLQTSRAYAYGDAGHKRITVLRSKANGWIEQDAQEMDKPDPRLRRKAHNHSKPTHRNKSLRSYIPSRKPGIKRPAPHQWHYCDVNYDPMAPLPKNHLPPYAPPAAHDKDYHRIYEEGRPKTGRANKGR